MMEKFRKKIVISTIISGIINLAAVGLCIFDLLIISEKISFQPVNEMLLSFQTGLVLGIGMVALMYTIKNRKALRDPKELQILYNKEHDERQQLIIQKAGMPMMAYTSGVMVIAGVIAGYYNTVVFYTLIVAAMAQLLVGLSLKLYYSRTI
ncbi:MAG: hypothetical protein H6Q59_1978 [Firmicutes bacterium]|nr:hypothetical protein [Bacillota bacterium]